MTKVKVHEKYMVVIPRDVREKLAIKVGDEVKFKLKMVRQ
ncbi:MAG: AbrB/MazE/SpoVT family DNA-binding domain-containing protein [Methanocellales archaeon]